MRSPGAEARPPILPDMGGHRRSGLQLQGRTTFDGYSAIFVRDMDTRVGIRTTVSWVAHSVEASGTTVAYDTAGSGPDLVFVHAGIADRTMWEPQISAFSDRYRCTAPDLRGFGDTPVGDEPFSRRDDLGAVLDSIGAQTATLVGCSIGAGIVLDFAIEQPERVNKLVLVGVTPSGFDFDDSVMSAYNERIAEAIERGDIAEAGRIEARLWVDGPLRDAGAGPSELRDKVVEWWLAINSITDWGESSQLNPSAMKRLDQVVAPTRVIVGAEDVAFVLAGCRAAADGIRGADLVELAGTAHLPNLEVPNDFNTTVAAFLD
jgi:3-oxoadipate enol-lactonase